MAIITKKDSVAKMKELGLNYFPLEIFKVEDLDGIKKFMDENPATEYCMRSVNKAKGEFCFVENFEQAKEKLHLFDQDVTVCVSYNEFKEDIVLVGDIIINKSFGSETVDITARTDMEATHRNIYENPQYNMHTSIEDDKLWNIPGISKIMRYISDHQLYNMIVEFAVYSIRIGVNKENVVISEIRTNY